MDHFVTEVRGQLLTGSSFPVLAHTKYATYVSNIDGLRLRIRHEIAVVDHAYGKKRHQTNRHGPRSASDERGYHGKCRHRNHLTSLTPFDFFDSSTCYSLCHHFESLFLHKDLFHIFILAFYVFTYHILSPEIIFTEYNPNAKVSLILEFVNSFQLGSGKGRHCLRFDYYREIAWWTVFMWRAGGVRTSVRKKSRLCSVKIKHHTLRSQTQNYTSNDAD